MDSELLAKSAETLERLLLQYSVTDMEAKELLNELAVFIGLARSKSIDSPIDWRKVPGAYYFTEGNLRKYDDLEAAYADFMIEITGGETPVLRKLREDRGEEK